MDYSSNNSLRKRLRDGNNTIEEAVFQCQSCKRKVCNKQMLIQIHFQELQWAKFISLPYF